MLLLNCFLQVFLLPLGRFPKSKDNTLIAIKLLMTRYNFKTWTEQEGELVCLQWSPSVPAPEECWAWRYHSTVSLSRRGVRHSSGPFPGGAVQRVVAAQKSSSALQAKETHSYVQVLLHLSLPWNIGMREGNGGDFRPRQKSRSWLTMPFPEAQNWVSWGIH